jgi:hypothetical protein
MRGDNRKTRSYKHIQSRCPEDRWSLAEEGHGVNHGMDATINKKRLKVYQSSEILIILRELH